MIGVKISSRLNAIQLPEDGTPVEKVAIAFNDQRCRKTFLPDGSAANPFGPQNYPECPVPADANFILNGLPNGPQMGAPFADPAVNDEGVAVGKKRTYKAAAIQMDAEFNKQGWHYQQQRLLTLWQDVGKTMSGKRAGAVLLPGQLGRRLHRVLAHQPGAELLPGGRLPGADADRHSSGSTSTS